MEFLFDMPVPCQSRLNSKKIKLFKKTLNLRRHEPIFSEIEKNMVKW